MAFISPLYLVALFPWAAVALYLFWSRRTKQDVPFLELWRGPGERSRAKTKLAVPPFALALAVVAMLLAILAAAGPTVRWAGTGARERATVIVDRGLTMSARGVDEPRFVEQARRAAAEIRDALPSVPAVDLIHVPGGDPTPTSADAWVAAVQRAGPTALDMREAVRRIVAERLAETDGPVIVISDADLGTAAADGRVVQYAPDPKMRNVGIVALAARASPTPQVMVRVRNDSELAAAPLVVSGGGQTARQQMQLPPAGTAKDFFIDVAMLGPIVEAVLEVQDDQPADDRAAVVREASWPAVEAAEPIGELQRLLDLYKVTRPPGEGSTAVRVVREPPRLGDAAGVIAAGVIAAGGESADREPVVRPTRVAPHAVTAGVGGWTLLDLPVVSANVPPEPGWTGVLWAGERALVAVRENGARQVWTALDTDRWSNRPEYVVFWTGLLDWVGRGGDAYAAHSLERWTPEWRPITGRATGRPGVWPGVYEREDGARRAFGLGRRDDAGPSVIGRRGSLQGRAVQQTLAAGRRELSTPLILAAIGCVTLSAACWRRGRRPGVLGQ